MGNYALEKAKAGYAEVERRYVNELTERGLVFEKRDAKRLRAKELRSELKDRGVLFRNGGASLSWGHLSPACIACTGSGGSETFSTTFKCHRDCYFCFNRNLPDYKLFFEEGCPWEETLTRCYNENSTLACIGLTGGEPLLNVDDSIAFLKRAGKLYPSAHKRMYTSGDLLTSDAAKRLADAGLDEIRFSVKDDDSPEMREKVLNAMRLAKNYIASVMVEMPIVPLDGAQARMKYLLTEFDAIGIDGINMLEFCFPFCNWPEFARRNLRLKNPPFEVMYDYGYSGGLAVAGSEELILELMLWAIDSGLSLGLHYCSLENKHRSEIRIKNERIASSFPMMRFDEEDFFLKAGKAFGADVKPVRKALEDAGCDDIHEDTDEDSITFSLDYIEKIASVVREDGVCVCPHVCSYVYECDDEGAYLVDVNLAPYTSENIS